MNAAVIKNELPDEIGYEWNMEDLSAYTSSGTKSMYQAIKDSVLSVHKDIRITSVSFYTSNNNLPTDMPASSAAWKYGFGRLYLRRSAKQNNDMDAYIFFYPFDNTATLYAVKSILNGTESSWKFVNMTT